jgi:Zn finger protein HypA/HybF involved in hydrogenase expression
MVRKVKPKKDKKAEKELKKKLGLFDQLPDECLTCEEPFDKKNREQVMSWNVVVRRDPDTVRLYCPDCWSKAQQIVKDFEERIKERESV